jgi:hypothetical protein
VSRRFILALGIVVAAVILGSCLRGYAMLIHKQLAHDEAVSYLAATGHMGAWQSAVNGGLNGKWEPSSAWRKLIEPGPFWDFGTIRSDLAHYDNHPPLYFWLLHIWIAIDGLNLNTGILLNIGIALVTAFLLFGFARTVVQDDLRAAAVPMVWTLSPPVFLTSMMARQYDLLAFFAVVFAWLLTWLTAPRSRLRWWSWLLVVLATAGGLLTHYEFSLVLAGGGVFAALRLWHLDRRRLAWLVGAGLAGVGLFVLGQPLFYLSVEHQGGQGGPATLGGFGQRVGNVVTGFAAFFGTRDAHWWLIGFGVLALGAAGALGLRQRAGRGPGPAPGDDGGGSELAPGWQAGAKAPGPLVVDGRQADSSSAGTAVVDPRARVWLSGTHAPAVFFLCWNAGTTVLLYLVFRSPVYAMHDRYLAAVWPFLAFVPLWLAGVFGRWRVPVVGLFCLAVLLPGTIACVHSFAPRTSSPVRSFQRAHDFVIVGVSRGNLTRVLWQVPNGKMVFADREQGVFAKKNVWLPRLQTRDWFIWALGDPENPAVIKEMQGWITARFPQHKAGSIWGLFRFWRVYPAPKPTG